MATEVNNTISKYGLRVVHVVSQMPSAFEDIRQRYDIPPGRISRATGESKYDLSIWRWADDLAYHHLYIAWRPFRELKLAGPVVFLPFTGYLDPNKMGKICYQYWTEFNLAPNMALISGQDLHRYRVEGITLQVEDINDPAGRPRELSKVYTKFHKAMIPGYLGICRDPATT